MEMVRVEAEITLHDYEVLLDWIMYGGNYTKRKNDPKQNELVNDLLRIVNLILMKTMQDESIVNKK